MGLKEIVILEEIGDLYFKEGELQLAIDAFRQVTLIDPKNGDGWEKLGDTCLAQNDKKQPNRKEAIIALKEAIELVGGETRKGNIALTLKEILESEGREDEIEPYRKYLLDQSSVS